MVSPSSRRRAVRSCVEEGLSSAAQACRAIDLARSSFYRPCQRSRCMNEQVLKLGEEKPRYGYRRITALLRRVGPQQSERLRATRPRQVWSWDLVEDQTENGSRFRILTLLDEYTRQCLAIYLAWSIRAIDAIRVLEAAIERYGAPEHLRSDNGPEFIAYAIQDWMKERAIKTLYIRPGSPWENGHIESFHDKLRDECLNREVFGTLAEACVILESWRVEYNEERPHSSLGYQTPEEFARSASKFGLLPAFGLLPSKLAKPILINQNLTQPSHSAG